MEWSRKVYRWSLFRQLGERLGGACPLCMGQSAPGSGFCPGCRADLPELGPACLRCAVPLPLDGLCGHCLRRSLPYSHAFAAFRYESPLSDLIIRLKFHGRLALAPPLGQLLAERLVHLRPPRPAVIVPVPLHPQRLRERGYNQALELARPVAKRLGIPLAPALGLRLRATASQANLDPAERRRNVRGAFGVNGAAPHSVAILDDVITTGSTAEAFAHALRCAGAKEIQIWALARATHR